MGMCLMRKQNIFMKQREDKNGYSCIKLTDGDKQHYKLIHRLLAQTFIENPNNYKEIDHIDRNRKNNNIDNLRWCTKQMNSHNRKNNNKELNIYTRKDNKGYRVRFTLKNYSLNKIFYNLDEAKEFRNIIQEKINNNETIDKLFIELYNNHMKFIRKTNCNNYQLRINKHNLKFYQTFKTLEQATQKRNQLLQN